MARKPNGNSSSGRNKPAKTASPAGLSVVPDVRKNVVSIGLDEEIRRRAYEIYLERGGVPGNENDDWAAAEREVRTRSQQRGQSA